MPIQLVFCGDWKGGELYHKRHTNRYRKIYEGDEEYIEFDLGNDIFGKCDVDSLHLIKKYSWQAKRNKTNVYIKTCVRKDKSNITLNLSHLVVGEIEYGEIVKYINGDTLDVRKKNLSCRSLKKKKEESEKVSLSPDMFDPTIVRPINKKVVRESIDPGISGKWHEGRYGGSLCRVESRKVWQICFQKPYYRKYFYDTTFGGKEFAKEAASEYRKYIAEERGLIYNRYQIITKPDGDNYAKFEGICRGKVKYFYCDIEDIPKVKQYKWGILKRREDSKAHEVMSYGKKKIRLHNFLTGYKIVDHIDGNPLNNRRCNLRDGQIINPKNHPKRKDNRSGMTGVSFNKKKNAWIVQWSEDGKRKCKQFGPGKEKLSQEESLELAIDFRREIDKKLQLHQQQNLHRE